MIEKSRLNEGVLVKHECLSFKRTDKNMLLHEYQ